MQPWFATALLADNPVLCHALVLQHSSASAPPPVTTDIAAIGYEHPKLSVSASFNGRGMADAMERAHRERFAPQSAAVINAERERSPLEKAHERLARLEAQREAD